MDVKYAETLKIYSKSENGASPPRSLKIATWYAAGRNQEELGTEENLWFPAIQRVEGWWDEFVFSRGNDTEHSQTG